MNPDLRLQHGLPPAAVPQAARLYWQAFGTKLGRVLGPEPRALAFFERAIRPDLCLAAIDQDGRLLALAGLAGPEGGFAGGSFSDLTQVYGHWGGRWRATALDALPRDTDPGRFLVDGLCVDQEYRGQGIGTALLAAAEALALSRGHGQIQIDVAAENHPAQRLYDRLGYRRANRRSTGPLRWIFGISATLSMVKDL